MSPVWARGVFVYLQTLNRNLRVFAFKWNQNSDSRVANVETRRQKPCQPPGVEVDPGLGEWAVEGGGGVLS